MQVWGSGPSYSGQMSCSMSAVLFNAYQTLFYLNEITGFVFKMKPTKRSLKFCPFNFSRASIFNIYSILGFGVYGRTRVMRILAVVMLLCHPSIDSIMNTSSRPPAPPCCMLHVAAVSCPELIEFSINNMTSGYVLCVDRANIKMEGECSV